MRCRRASVYAAAIAASAVVGAPSTQHVGGTRLGVRGTAFTLNGRPTFLLGISYYGGLGATHATWDRDLAETRRRGINWIRVWATWKSGDEDISAVDADGRPREHYLGRLRDLVRRCDRIGMVVDVTLSRGTNGILSLGSHEQAVRTIVTALKGQRNWYLDVGNERNVRDSRYVPIDEVGALSDVAKSLDPDLLVTASQGGDISQEEAGRYLTVGMVDFLAPHRPRDSDSAAQTEGRTEEYLRWATGAGRPVPVHYQEPFRRGYGAWQPAAADYVADLKGAVAGGAAGWCFHNGSNRGGADDRPRRSFDLRDGPLFGQLDSVEVAALDEIGGLIPIASPAPGRL